MSEHIITEEEATFPSTPFLLWEKDVNGQHVGDGPYVVERWNTISIQILDDCCVTQTIDAIVHTPSKEEIERYMEGKYNKDE